MVGAELADPSTGRNGRHAMTGLFRQSVFGRLGGYEDGIEILGANFFFLFIGLKVGAWAGCTVTGVLDLINALCNAQRLRPHATKGLTR